MSDWLKEVKMNAGSDCLTFLVGNQKDREEEREVTVEQALKYQKEKSLNHSAETSAKTGENVEEVFVHAAKQLFKKYRNDFDKIMNKEGKLKINKDKKPDLKPARSGCKC